MQSTQPGAWQKVVQTPWFLFSCVPLRSCSEYSLAGKAACTQLRQGKSSSPGRYTPSWLTQKYERLTLALPRSLSHALRALWATPRLDFTNTLTVFLGSFLLPLLLLLFKQDLPERCSFSKSPLLVTLVPATREPDVRYLKGLSSNNSPQSLLTIIPTETG